MSFTFPLHYLSQILVLTTPASAIEVTTTSTEIAFHLSTPTLSYHFHVPTVTHSTGGLLLPTGDLVHDHFGSPTTEPIPYNEAPTSRNEIEYLRTQREFADLGRGDYRLPAVHVRYPAGHTVSHFTYKSHEVIPGKPKLDGLPATWGKEDEVTTLQVRMEDKRSGLEAVLSYAVFKACGAIARSVKLENKGEGEVEILRLASWGGDLDVGEWEMVQLCGDWARENKEIRRKVYPGTQG